MMSDEDLDGHKVKPQRKSRKGDAENQSAEAILTGPRSRRPSNRVLEADESEAAAARSLAQAVSYSLLLRIILLMS